MLAPTYRGLLASRICGRKSRENVDEQANREIDSDPQATKKPVD
jgi:hypothetical protein